MAPALTRDLRYIIHRYKVPQNAFLKIKNLSQTLFHQHDTSMCTVLPRFAQSPLMHAVEFICRLTPNNHLCVSHSEETVVSTYNYSQDPALLRHVARAIKTYDRLRLTSTLKVSQP